MGLVEEEHEHGPVLVAGLRQLFEEFGQEPQQERGVELGRFAQQRLGVEQADGTDAGEVLLHQVAQSERRLAEKLIAALFFQHQQAPLDRAHGGGRDVAVLLPELLRVFRHEAQHAAQILQIEEQHALVVSQREAGVQDARLGIVEV